MADEDDKVRRNLVMVSSAILISAWLEVPFAAFIGKLVDISYVKPDSWKVWVVGFFVMIYLALRYSFSSDGSDYRTSVKSEIDMLRRHKAVDFAQSQADSFTNTGKEPVVFRGELGGLIANVQAERPASHRPKMKVTLAEQRDTPWSFKAGIDFEWPTTGGGFTSCSGNTLDVLIAGRQRWLVEAKTQLHCWVYSESSIKYLVPVVLGLSATATLFGKVIQAYCTSQ
jgi:hypothetical protein